MYTVLHLDYKIKLNTVSQTTAQSTSHKTNYISISTFSVESKECNFNPSTLKNWKILIVDKMYSNIWIPYLMKKQYLHKPSAFSPQIFEIYFWTWKDIRGLDSNSQSFYKNSYWTRKQKYWKIFNIISSNQVFGLNFRIYILKDQGFQI